MKPTPVDPAVRQQLWGPGFSHHVLAVGSLKSAKNYPLLLRAFAQLPQSLNAKLTILGEGPLRPELEALIQKLGSVHILGQPDPGAARNRHVPDIRKAQQELDLSVTVPLVEAIRRSALP